MKYLLDTHAWVWSVLGDGRLGRNARRTLDGLAGAERVGLASISLKEAAWHLAHGRLEVTGQPWQAWLRAAAQAPHVEVLPLTVDIAIESERFPAEFPADPADRLIGATARVHDLVLVTADRVMRESAQLRTLW